MIFKFYFKVNKIASRFYKNTYKTRISPANFAILNVFEHVE